MNTLILKKNSFAINSESNEANGKFFNVLLWALGALTLAYMFFLGATVFNIVERKSLETEGRALVNEVGNLESQYLSVSGQIDVAYAESIGFKEANKQYATRRSLGYKPADGFGNIKLSADEL